MRKLLIQFTRWVLVWLEGKGNQRFILHTTPPDNRFLTLVLLSKEGETILYHEKVRNYAHALDIVAKTRESAISASVNFSGLSGASK